ncbi:BC_2427 family protein [Bacillus sp. FSL E2-8887]|uniref:BC_2427 family protein n=1 Tax=Bacillus sp. FSL E2-8887 TaxID=2954599 RepID=UPI0030FAF707
MNKPWVGKEIWNKVYKWKMLNIQDDSREIREKKESKETESKKEEKAMGIEKESKETESKKEDKVIGIEKESEKTGLTKENKAMGIEKESKETESKKEDKVIGIEKESEKTGLTKENKAIGIEKESKETESKKEDKVIGIEKESEKTGLTKENKAIGLEEEEVKIESVKEYEERELEKEEKAIESNKESEETEPAKENKVIGLEKVEVANESEKKSEETESKRESIGLGSKIETSVHSMVVKTPFSIISEVSSFKVFPKINVKNQDAFVFRNEKDAEGRELDSKLLTTVQQYHSEAYCKLVSLNLHEKRVLVELYNQKVKGNNEENKVETSSWIPIHSIILESENGGEVSNYITARLPIEIGRYKGEISLREKVVFTEKVIGIKEVEQEIVLTKTEFLVPKVKKNGQNKFTVEKGSLLVEGYIYQCIEYISEQSTFHDNVYQLVQNIVLELIIQVIQEQEVQVRIT